jgi:hypothetical protein
MSPIVLMIIVYVAGFIVTFWVNATSMPITPGLALMRAAFWPILLVTGWPRGTPLPMD